MLNQAWRNSRLFILFGVIVVFVSNLRPWAKVVVTEEFTPQLPMTFTGRDIEVMPSAFTVVIVAALLIIGFLRGAPLRTVQVIVAGAALGVFWFSLNGHDVSNKVSDLVANSVGRNIEAMTVTTYPWWIASSIGSVLILLGVGFGLISTPPPRKSRYERQPSDEDLSPWQSLDAGIDPTVPDSIN